MGPRRPMGQILSVVGDNGGDDDDDDDDVGDDDDDVDDHVSFFFYSQFNSIESRFGNINPIRRSRHNYGITPSSTKAALGTMLWHNAIAQSRFWH